MSKKPFSRISPKADKILLQQAGIDVTEEGAAEAVSRMTEYELLRLPGCGRTTLYQILDWLHGEGFLVGEEKSTPAIKCPHCLKMIALRAVGKT